MSLNLLKIGAELDVGEIHISLDEHKRALMALDVSGYPDEIFSKKPFGYNKDIFLFDSWDKAQGLCYLVGIEWWNTDFETGFTEIKTLDHEKFSSAKDIIVISYFMENLSRIRKVWDSGSHNARNPPKYYIDWAKSKGIEIPWLGYAEREGLVDVSEASQYVKKQEAALIIEADKPLRPRRENNYLRLIYSLCFSLKGFDPSARPHTIAKLIIDETGIDISQETLANFIEKAKALENKERD
jgi:hypothetical protein